MHKSHPNLIHTLRHAYIHTYMRTLHTQMLIHSPSTLASVESGQERLQERDEEEGRVGVEELEEKYLGDQRILVLGIGAMVFVVILTHTKQEREREKESARCG